MPLRVVEAAKTLLLLASPLLPHLLRDCPNQKAQPIVERKEQAQMCEPASRKRYPSDLMDAQWQMIGPFIPPISPNAMVSTIERREIVNAILYILRTGCYWR